MPQQNNRLQPTYDLPKADQLEISLFGPGYGECLVVHYAKGRWFTVDSCLESDRKTPSALAYFDRLGVDPAKSVTHNIITHSDGDHIGGILDLYSTCESARLVCPITLDNRSMLGFITYFAQTDPTPLTQTTRELYEVLNCCFDRPPNTPIFVSQDRPFIVTDGVRVTALSPPDNKIKKFLGYISTLIPNEKSDRRAPKKLRPNEFSAACLLETTGFAAVFGADLEETPGKGWTTILETSIAFNEASAPRVFKVAHHGSKNADCPDFWATMNKSYAILSPFKLGSHKIPTPDDIERILARTNNAFSASSFKTQHAKKLSRVDKVLSRHNIRRRDLYPKNGHIRLRVDATNVIQIDKFQNAVHLSQVH